MKEQNKYDVVKELVDHGGNKKRAALKLGISLRHINRLINTYKNKGKDGFVHHNKNRQPVNSFPAELSATILTLYHSKYQDCNFSHFRDLLESRENISVSYSFLYRLLSKNGILSIKVQKATRRRAAKEKLNEKKNNMSGSDIEIAVSHQLAIEDSHPRKQRAKYAGEEIQMDGSIHNWFSDFKCCLHLAIDNCTGTVVGAFFEPQETLSGYYKVFYQILTNYGIPYCFKTDNRTVFNYESHSRKSDSDDVLTQFGYACKQLGTSIVTSSVSQAKGQIERANGTFQSRLASELKIEGIDNIEDANRYLIERFVPDFNSRFASDISKAPSVFETVPDSCNLNHTLSVLSPRVFDNGSSIKYENSYYQAYDSSGSLCCFIPKTKCLVIKAFDGNLYVTVDEHVYALKKFERNTSVSPDFDHMDSNIKKPKNIYIPPMSHPWKHSSFVAQQKKAHKDHVFV